MKCEEVQEYLSEYADGSLPEITRRRIDQHMAGCRSCKMDYRLWTESSSLIQEQRDHYTAVASARSIVDAVMARILSEEKWAIPLGRKVFTLTARMRRMGASAAAVLLLICAFTLFNQTEANEMPMMPLGEIVAMYPEDKPVVTLASDPSVEAVAPEDEALPPLTEEVEMSAMQIVPLTEDTDTGKPNYGLILSFFGILVTVLGMSWMTRA